MRALTKGTDGAHDDCAIPHTKKMSRVAPLNQNLSSAHRSFKAISRFALPRGPEPAVQCYEFSEIASAQCYPVKHLSSVCLPFDQQSFSSANSNHQVHVGFPHRDFLKAGCHMPTERPCRCLQSISPRASLRPRSSLRWALELRTLVQKLGIDKDTVQIEDQRPKVCFGASVPDHIRRR
jgi:hypothetical protein